MLGCVCGCGWLVVSLPMCDLGTNKFDVLVKFDESYASGEKEKQVCTGCWGYHTGR